MRWKRAGGYLLLLGTIGCSADRVNLSDKRPPATPVPPDVQTEIRDARFFLPYPDDRTAPETGFTPRNNVKAPSSF